MNFTCGLSPSFQRGLEHNSRNLRVFKSVVQRPVSGPFGYGLVAHGVEQRRDGRHQSRTPSRSAGPRGCASIQAGRGSNTIGCCATTTARCGNGGRPRGGLSTKSSGKHGSATIPARSFQSTSAASAIASTRTLRDGGGSASAQAHVDPRALEQARADLGIVTSRSNAGVQWSLPG